MLPNRRRVVRSQRQAGVCSSDDDRLGGEGVWWMWVDGYEGCAKRLRSPILILQFDIDIVNKTQEDGSSEQ